MSTSSSNPLPPADPDRLAAVVARLAGASVLVVGDAILDTFISGRVTRISPEAPVPVVAFDHERHRLGGAANAAHNVAALGGSVALAGVTGQDKAAAALDEACRYAGIVPAFVAVAGRPTTTKVRIVTDRHQQVARIDYESDADISSDVEERMISTVQRYAPDMGAIIISDYFKGCITARVAEAPIAAAAERIPVLVDPKVPHIGYYAGAALIKPNHHEAELATNRRIRTDDDARAAARLFRDRAACGAVLVTRGDQGMWLCAAGLEGALPTSAREVADVTGAGDTVIAVLALALAAGASLADAAQLANEAAGIAVGKFGTAVVTSAELRRAIEGSGG